VSYQDRVRQVLITEPILEWKSRNFLFKENCGKHCTGATADSSSRNCSRAQLLVRARPALHLCGFCVALCFVKRKLSDHCGFKEHLNIASSKKSIRKNIFDDLLFKTQSSLNLCINRIKAEKWQKTTDNFILH